MNCQELFTAIGLNGYFDLRKLDEGVSERLGAIPRQEVGDCAWQLRSHAQSRAKDVCGCNRDMND